MPSVTAYTLDAPRRDESAGMELPCFHVSRGDGVPPALVEQGAGALAFRAVPPSQASPLSAAARPTVCLRAGEPNRSSPQPDWSRVATDPQGTVWRTPEGLHWEGAGGQLQWRDGNAWIWIENPDTPAGRRALTGGLRRALTGAMVRLGWTPLHAAALRRPPDISDAADMGDAGGVLLVGASGSGKSTLTAGLLQRGWRCVSDDQVALAPAGESPDGEPPAGKSPASEPPEASRRVWRLSPTLRLCPNAWTRLGFDNAAFSASASRVPEPYTSPSDPAENGPTGNHPVGNYTAGNDPAGNDPTGKWSVPLSAITEAAPERTALSAVPRHIVRVGIADRAESELVPACASELFPALLSQSPPPAVLPSAAAAAQTQRLSSLLHQAKGFDLKAGRDLHEAPGRLADLMAAATSCAPAATSNA
jgi:hypothetical protein